MGTWANYKCNKCCHPTQPHSTPSRVLGRVCSMKTLQNKIEELKHYWNIWSKKLRYRSLDKLSDLLGVNTPPFYCQLHIFKNNGVCCLMPRSHTHGSLHPFYYGLNLTDDPGNANFCSPIQMNYILWLSTTTYDYECNTESYGPIRIATNVHPWLILRSVRECVTLALQALFS